MGIDDIQEREEEEQRVIAATIRSRVHEGPESGVASSDGSESSISTFGSSLQQIMRARSESLGDVSEQTDSEHLASLALPPDERRALEEEMRAQHSHPLARRVEAEAEERRIQNEREYYRTHSGRIRERYSPELLRFGLGSGLSGMPPDAAQRGLGGSTVQSGLAAMPSGPRRVRDWNQIVDAFESAGHGEVQSLDDLVVLEAAILLSMEEETRRNQLEGRTGLSSFDAASHAREGFPLVQQFLNARGATDDEGEDPLQTSVRSVGRPARRRSSLLQGRLRRLSASTGSTRSLTEEEQVALAIAASLREFGTPSSSDDAGDQSEQQADAIATPEGQRVFYGRPVAVGVAAPEIRPAVGIMVEDGEDSRPAVGMSNGDDDDEESPAMRVMVDDCLPVRRLAVGVMAADEPDHSLAEVTSASSSANKDHHTDDVHSGEEVQAAAKLGVRSIASGDAVVSTCDDDEVDGTSLNVDETIGESAMDDLDESTTDLASLTVTNAPVTEHDPLELGAPSNSCEVAGETRCAPEAPFSNPVASVEETTATSNGENVTSN